MRLYISTKVEEKIRSYCELNDIEDVNAFANRCCLQGLNILKYGTSPNDNISREDKGIKDISKDELKGYKEEELIGAESSESAEPIKEEESKPREEGKEGVKVRKIRVIKKDK